MSKVGESWRRRPRAVADAAFRQVDARLCRGGFPQQRLLRWGGMRSRRAQGGGGALGGGRGKFYISACCYDLVRKRGALFLREVLEGKDHQSVAGDFVTALEKHQRPSARGDAGEYGHESGLPEGSGRNLPQRAGGVATSFTSLRTPIRRWMKLRRAEVRLGGAGVWEALRSKPVAVGKIRRT